MINETDCQLDNYVSHKRRLYTDTQRPSVEHIHDASVDVSRISQGHYSGCITPERVHWRKSLDQTNQWPD